MPRRDRCAVLKQARWNSLSPFGERAGVRGSPTADGIPERTKPLTPPLSHPNSGLPEFGTLSCPKSDRSDLGWEREQAESVASLWFNLTIMGSNPASARAAA